MKPEIIKHTLNRPDIKIIDGDWEVVGKTDEYWTIYREKEDIFVFINPPS